MKHLTTKAQRDELQKLIQTELLKRGFTAQIISFDEIFGRHETSIEFNTEKFQTTPVIFESIRVENFSSSLKKVEKEREDNSHYMTTHFWICVHVSYTHFEGGTNGCKIFDISGDFYEDESGVASYNIR